MIILFNLLIKSLNISDLVSLETLRCTCIEYNYLITNILISKIDKLDRIYKLNGLG